MTATPPPADPNLPPQQPQQPQYQQPQQPQYQPAAPLTDAQDANIAGWQYLSASLGWVIPLILWLIFKDRGPRSNNEGKEALNFGITVSIAHVVVWIVFGIINAAVVASNPFAYFTGFAWWLLIQWLLTLAIFVVALMWGFKGRGVVLAGGAYRYPFNIRFLK